MRRICVPDVILSVDIVEACASEGAVPHLWQRRLADRLTTAVGGSVAIVALSAPASGGVVEIDEAQMSSGAGADLRDSFERFSRDGAFAILPEFRRIAAVLARHGRIAYRQASLLGHSAYLRSEMHQRYLRPHGIEDHVAAIRVLADGRSLGVSVHRGRRERPFDQRDEDLLRLIVELISRKLEIPDSAERTAPPQRTLTPRLEDALAAILQGASEKQIARALSLSAATVHQYVQMLYRLHAVHSRSELMALYLNPNPGRLALARPSRTFAATE